jgi:hypothetical protein
MTEAQIRLLKAIAASEHNEIKSTDPQLEGFEGDDGTIGALEYSLDIGWVEEVYKGHMGDYSIRLTDTGRAILAEQNRLQQLLHNQLQYALHPDAVFCCGCGQPDESDLHDREQCNNYQPGQPSIAMALDFFDQVQEDLPDDREQAILGAFLKAYRPPVLPTQTEGTN